MSAYLSVCESIKKVYCPWPVTYISYVTALAETELVLETSPGQNNPTWSTHRKYVVVSLDQTGNSGGESVCLD